MERVDNQSKRMCCRCGYLMERAGFVKEMMVYEFE